MFQLSGMIEMFNVDNESDSANTVCLMNVSTVSSVMDISVNEVNVDNESDSANAVCVMNVSTVSSVMDISVNEGVDQNTPLLPRILFSMKKNCKSLLKDINIQRRAQLTPRKALLYNSVRVYKHRNLILKKRYSDAKQRIKIADTYINSKSNSLNGLNQFTQNFIESQMRMQPQKPRGRRFTIDDKVFALSLFKQSGKAYSTLSKVFALPSRKSITDLLKKVPFETGINKKIFEHLKGSVKKLKNKLDRFCTVIFDEVSISASLQFNESNGKVIGFEDLGQSDRSTKFADKALVFMVRGIRKKFKQPVAFYLTTSNMNGLKLAKIIKEVIEAVQSTGLTVISTVCDQATY
ncbi:hypothetical protein ACI65C_002800 [Semiaphis heraclei]